MEDSGLQIITLWGPTIGNFENINLEILDLPSPKGSKTRVHGGGVAYIYIYIYFYALFRVDQSTILEGTCHIIKGRLRDARMSHINPMHTENSYSHLYSKSPNRQNNTKKQQCNCIRYRACVDLPVQRTRLASRRDEAARPRGRACWARA